MYIFRSESRGMIHMIHWCPQSGARLAEFVIDLGESSSSVDDFEAKLQETAEPHWKLRMALWHPMALWPVIISSSLRMVDPPSFRRMEQRLPALSAKGC